MLSLATMLAACAPQTEVIDLYENFDYLGHRYSYVLVVNTEQRKNDRERFESMQASALRDVGSKAVTSHSVVGFDVVVTEEVLAEAISKSGADAVLITQIVSNEISTSKIEGRVRINKECRKVEFYDPFLYDYAEIQEPDSTSISHTVVVVASLYDASNNERLWTAQSTCFDRQTRDEVLLDQATTIAAELRRDWLTP